MEKQIVITTINKKSQSIEQFSSNTDYHLLIIGDKKSYPIESSDNLTFYSVEDQMKMEHRLAKKLPYDHYVRKNLGYLEALRLGAHLIYETDDDNIPYDHWGVPKFNSMDITMLGNNKYCNIYRQFTDVNIWPRGYPLQLLGDNQIEKKKSSGINLGVWQGLADIDPDVDAIYRLTRGDKVYFNGEKEFALSRGTYCPFNSQNTWWTKPMLPYAYLPATVASRVTDILRGYICQRCMWEHDLLLGFGGASVYQERNAHDLLKDFEEEIPLYLRIDELVRYLDSLDLCADYERNMIVIYQGLIERNFVQADEMTILQAWLEDCQIYL